MSDFVEKRRVVLGVTGSIAAYKSVELLRLLTTRGYEVRVVMTESACEFVQPLTFETLTKNPVVRNFWDEGKSGSIGHIDLADWADLLVIAPASADCLAKLAHGFADSPLLAIALATKAPILLAPAMNVNMLRNRQTQDNLDMLRARGFLFVDPEEGELACGWTGPGRLANPREIFNHIRRALTMHDFSGKKILIATGPTREPIDPVRFVSNRSSGKMGFALAAEAFRRGGHVTMVHGPIAIPAKVPGPVKKVSVTTAEQMREKIFSLVYPNGNGEPAFDIVIMAAAVADYRPEKVSEQKIKKDAETRTVSFIQNPDILKDLGAKKSSSRAPCLVGFAVETGEIEELIPEFRRKLTSKNADLMVGNRAEEAFEVDTNRVWIVTRSGKEQEVATTFKSRVAVKIFDAISKL